MVRPFVSPSLLAVRVRGTFSAIRLDSEASSAAGHARPVVRKKKEGVTQVAQTCAITLRLGRDPFTVRLVTREALKEEGSGPPAGAHLRRFRKQRYHLYRVWSLTRHSPKEEGR